MNQFLSGLRSVAGLSGRQRRSKTVRSQMGRVGSESLESRIVLSAITGTIYDDVDSSGTKTGPDNTLGRWQVYVDLDNSGTFNNKADGTPEPSAIANAGGDYTLNMNAFPTGLYRVSEVVQAGWTPTVPASRDVAFTRGQDSNKVDFFNFAGGNIVGTVWNDLNADGIRAVNPGTGAFTDPGLAGWTVFLDLKPVGGGAVNGIPDPGEPVTVTDSLGHYSFSNLPAGDYEVTEVKPAGWDIPPGIFDTKQTVTVKALKTSSQDFANFSTLNGSISGKVWNDTNADGVRQVDPTTGAFTEPGLAGWTIFLDSNNNKILDTTNGSAVFDVASSGLASVSVTATEADNDTANTAPIVSISAATDGFRGVRGQVRSFTVSTSDSAADIAAGFNYTINWGDGATQMLSAGAHVTISHTFLAAAVFHVSVVAEDQRAAVSTPATKNVSILVTELQGTQLAVGGTRLNDAFSLAQPSPGTFGVLLGGKSVATYAPGSSGSIKLYGNSGVDTLSAMNQSNVWNLTGAYSGTLNTNFVFQDIENLKGGTLDDTFQFTDAASGFGIVNGSTGIDVFDFSLLTGPVIANLAAGSVNGVASFTGVESVIGSGSIADTITGPNKNTTWTINGMDSGKAGALSFSSFENLVGGLLNDTFRLSTLDASISGLIQGGDGVDSLNAFNIANVWNLTGDRSGDLNGRAFHGIENLNGGIADDTFRIKPTGSLFGGVSGGNGVNVLDYSFWVASGVAVDLGTGTATGCGSVSGITIVIGSAQDDTLTGDDGDNILIGGAGNDVLNGIGGRDVLIGGSGADVLHGGAGDDLLFGGKISSYNEVSKAINLPTLKTIRTKWTSATTYAARVSSLLGVQLKSTTLTDDAGAIDQLFGDSETDWFLTRLGDVVSDAAAETVTLL